MFAFIKGALAKSFVSRVSNDKKATVLGVIAGSLIAAQIDWSHLIQGDSREIGKAVGAVVAALIGYYTNKKDQPKPVQDNLNEHASTPR